VGGCNYPGWFFFSVILVMKLEIIFLELHTRYLGRFIMIGHTMPLPAGIMWPILLWVAVYEFKTII